MVNKIKVAFQRDAWEDYLYWQNQDKKTLKRINNLISSIIREGIDKGIGKPEPLKFELIGYWSRRIDKTNRLVYTVQGNVLIIIECRLHYTS
jgi:toxin YoeB